MGMDVYGLAPRSQAGEYFRNSIWGWHPLALFLVTQYPELTDACEHWGTNDGDGLDADMAAALAAAVKADLAAGKVAEYARQRDAALAALPLLDCTFCNATGTRTDEVGRAHGMDRRGWCNACDGTGQHPHPAASFVFTVENVTNFAAFLADCGGFQIW